jgi:hypothetical protein
MFTRVASERVSQSKSAEHGLSLWADFNMTNRDGAQLRMQLTLALRPDWKEPPMTHRNALLHVIASYEGLPARIQWNSLSAQSTAAPVIECLPLPPASQEYEYSRWRLGWI